MSDEDYDTVHEWSLVDAGVAVGILLMAGLAHADYAFRPAMESIAGRVPLITWAGVNAVLVLLALFILLVMVPPKPRRHVDEWERELYED